LRGLIDDTFIVGACAPKKWQRADAQLRRKRVLAELRAAHNSQNMGENASECRQPSRAWVLQVGLTQKKVVSADEREKKTRQRTPESDS
jgi:hypothetical protein